MRVLFVSNFYPPVTHGGYEQLCREVALGLAERGYTLGVLTGHEGRVIDGGGSEEDGISVFRLLNREVEGSLFDSAIRMLWHRERLERENRERIHEVLANFAPNVVMLWGMWNLPRGVPVTLEEMCVGRIAYYLCDYWPTLPSAYQQQWQEPARRKVTRVAKRVLGGVVARRLQREERLALRFESVHCVSRALRDILIQSGVPLRNVGVIYGNAKFEQFSCAASSRQKHASLLRLVYCGRLAAAKGVHTAIHAVGLLPPRYQVRVCLDIVGAGAVEYEQELRQLVRRLRLDERVRFLSSVPRDEVPGVLSDHDVLVFPSEWEEPFARIVLEAMAAGVVVIGSNTGGTPEVLFDDRTGLMFPAGNAAALMHQIVRLIDEPATRERLAAAGRQLVAEQFTFTQTVDAIESALGWLLSDAVSRPLACRTF